MSFRRSSDERTLCLLAFCTSLSPYSTSCCTQSSWQGKSAFNPLSLWGHIGKRFDFDHHKLCFEFSDWPWCLRNEKRDQDETWDESKWNVRVDNLDVVKILAHRSWNVSRNSVSLVRGKASVSVRRWEGEGISLDTHTHTHRVDTRCVNAHVGLSWGSQCWKLSLEGNTPNCWVTHTLGTL